MKQQEPLKTMQSLETWTQFSIRFKFGWRIYRFLTIYGVVAAFIGSREQSSLILSHKKFFLGLTFVSQFRINVIYLFLKKLAAVSNSFTQLL